MDIQHPITLFKQLYQQEVEQTHLTIPSACCFSTIGLDGFPNSRFVSCKEVINEQFIITGNKLARKGLEIKQTPKASLAFWWTETQVQVRVQGQITELNQTIGQTYFQERQRESQIVSIVSEQGAILHDLTALEQRYHDVENAYLHKPLPTPESFGAWAIDPLRIEFLLFSASRFHQRFLFEKQGKDWAKTHIQP